MQVLITVVQNSVERTDIGVATSSVTFFRQMGGSFGTALFGAILSSAGSRCTSPTRSRASRPGSAGGNLGDVANNVQAIKALPEPVHSLSPARSAPRCTTCSCPPYPSWRWRSSWRSSSRRSPLATRDATPAAGSRTPRPRSSSRTDPARTRARTPGGSGLSSSPGRDAQVASPSGRWSTSRSVRAVSARCSTTAFSGGDERDGDQRAGDAGDEHAHRDRHDHAERVHRDQPAEQERLQDVRLELLHGDHAAEHDQRDDRALGDQRDQHRHRAGQQRADHRDEARR